MPKELYKLSSNYRIYLIFTFYSFKTTIWHSFKLKVKNEKGAANSLIVYLHSLYKYKRCIN